MTQKSYVVLFMRGPARTGRPLGKKVLDKCIKEVYNKGVERMVFKMTLTTWNNETKEYYIYPEAWALYDGGWRKEDWELFKETYKEETYTEDDKTEFERAMETCENIAKQKEE